MLAVIPRRKMAVRHGETAAGKPSQQTPPGLMEESKTQWKTVRSKLPVAEDHQYSIYGR